MASKPETHSQPQFRTLVLSLGQGIGIQYRASPWRGDSQGGGQGRGEPGRALGSRGEQGRACGEQGRAMGSRAEPPNVCDR